MNDVQKIKADIEAARASYRPEHIKLLLIAEAPPDAVKRFFYYPDVKRDDWLFMGVTEVLYPSLKQFYKTAKRPTHLKEALLRRFRADGYYLMDLLEVPRGMYPGKWEEAAPNLLARVEQTIHKQTPIILIKTNVYDIAQPVLKKGGFNVVEERIQFPSSGQQKKFREGFQRALTSLGWNSLT